MMRKMWTNEEDIYLQNNHLDKTNAELAAKLKRTKKAIIRRKETLFLRKPEKEYAVYRDDDLLSVGTAKEVSEELGIKEKTLYSYVSRKAGRRYAVEIEPDDDLEVEIIE